MPHFVITPKFDGGACFAVEYFHECKHADGRAFVHSCYEISDATAARPLNDLITDYKNGIRPKSKKPPATPIESKPNAITP